MARADEIVAEHGRAGRQFEAAGLRSYVREQGAGEVALLVHGVPVSSFLYRRMLPELAARGMRAVAFDLPGLGLAERPERFDYSWSGLAAWFGAAVDALKIERCHLVVHDIGGPIAFEWAIRNPGRIASLTALDTLIDVSRFRRPWPMHPFSIRGIGEAWLRATPPLIFSELYYRQGISDRSAVSRAEIYAHHRLLRRVDDGRAFLKVMRGFELTAEKERFLVEGLAAASWPRQIVWGEKDPALGRRRRLAVEEALGVEAQLLPAKHFLQEDHPVELAVAIASQAGSS